MTFAIGTGGRTQPPGRNHPRPRKTRAPRAGRIGLWVRAFDLSTACSVLSVIRDETETFERRYGPGLTKSCLISPIRKLGTSCFQARSAEGQIGYLRK
jgi:hypothetical protein